MKISRSRDWPKGLYFRLKRSKRWKVFLSACMSSVSTFRSYLHPRAPSSPTPIPYPLCMSNVSTFRSCLHPGAPASLTSIPYSMWKITSTSGNWSSCSETQLSECHGQGRTQ